MDGCSAAARRGTNRPGEQRQRRWNSLRDLPRRARGRSCCLARPVIRPSARFTRPSGGVGAHSACRRRFGRTRSRGHDRRLRTRRAQSLRAPIRDVREPVNWLPLPAASCRRIRSVASRSLLQARCLEPGVHGEASFVKPSPPPTSAASHACGRACPCGQVRSFRGGRIVTGSRDGKVRVYATGSSRPTLVMSQDAPVTAAEYSTDGRSCSRADGIGQARLVVRGKGKLRLTLSMAGAPLRDRLSRG